VILERWCITIQWDAEGDYTSPPIGPISSHSEAERYAKLIRKGLRANGKVAQGRVKVTRMTHPEAALRWESVVIR
jgi:hypothetical protein